jgi:hypothetical protein
VTLRRPGTAWRLLVLTLLFVAASMFLTNEDWPLSAVLVMGSWLLALPCEEPLFASV